MRFLMDFKGLKVVYMKLIYFQTDMIFILNNILNPKVVFDHTHITLTRMKSVLR